MTLETTDLAIVAGVMTFGAFVQGAVGFASGLLGVPALVLCGFSLLEASVINYVSTSVQNIVGAVQLRHHVSYQEVRLAVLLRALWLPLGVLALAASRSLDPAVVRQIVGLLLLASVLLLLGVRPKPRERLHPVWGWLAFSTSGFLTGFASIGGAPLVMYVSALTWSAAKCRSFLFICSAAIVPLMGLMLWWQFGMSAAKPAVAAAITLPPVMLGLYVGLHWGNRLDKVLFRRIAYGLLLAVAILSMLSPWFM